MQGYELRMFYVQAVKVENVDDPLSSLAASGQNDTWAPKVVVQTESCELAAPVGLPTPQNEPCIGIPMEEVRICLRLQTVCTKLPDVKRRKLRLNFCLSLRRSLRNRTSQGKNLVQEPQHHRFVPSQRGASTCVGGVL